MSSPLHKTTPQALVACEESQRVCTELRLIGIDAYSCDILDCSGGHPEWHIKQSVEPLLNGKVSFKTCDNTEHYVENWDLIIAHPPCTYLTVAGNAFYYPSGYRRLAKSDPDLVNSLIEKRKANRESAIKFFMIFTNVSCKHVAIENPVGVMSTVYRRPDCIIQPYQFGSPVSKSTCFWLKGLPPLKPTCMVEPAKRIMYSSGKSVDPWHAETFRLKPAERAKERSKTFPGIAKAIAEQWGGLILNELLAEDNK